MRDIRPAATLTARLLAPKGTARPAMRPSVVPQDVAVPPPPAVVDSDLGWNDMGDSDVHRQQDAIAEHFSGGDAADVESVVGRPAAFTLRLNPKRHLKLRLASTILNRSVQQLLTEALDRLLAEYPNVETLAEHIGGDR
jgi:hypothetical protein